MEDEDSRADDPSFKRVRNRIVAVVVALSIYLFIALAFGGYVAHRAAHSKWVEKPYGAFNASLFWVTVFLADESYQDELVKMIVSADQTKVSLAAKRLEEVADGLKNQTVKRLNALLIHPFASAAKGCW